MIPAGREIVIGGLNDPQFGPMLMVGLGGIFVEVLKDVSFRLCPITQAEACDMLAELKGAALLDGVRGEAGVDKQALIDIILKVGGADGIMMKTVGLIAEVDLNPIIVSQKGAVAADARFILSETEAQHRKRRAGSIDFRARALQAAVRAEDRRGARRLDQGCDDREYVHPAHEEFWVCRPRSTRSTRARRKSKG